MQIKQKTKILQERESKNEKDEETRPAIKKMKQDIWFSDKS
jgi:hypothetical protein